MTPRQAERGTHDSERHDTTSLFAALNVATGEEIHLLLDNRATHKTRADKRALQKPRTTTCTSSLIPTSSS